ncbi:MAG: DUF2911 domain-containing protein [Bacteroidota bacterium]
MKKLLFSTLALLLTMTSFAQIKTPAASPSASFTQAVGLQDVMVEYSRPSMKGRTIFAADGLVPFGKVWRTGANAATKITFGDKIMLGGETVEAGSYAVLTMPDANEWTFMLFPYESGSWSSYKEADPAYTFKAATKKTDASVETFTIGIGHMTNNSAHLTFSWENTMVAIPMKMDIHSQVMSDIKQVMAGPSTNDYYRAASYLHDSDTDLKTALEYIQKANDTDEQRYWMVRREALILADLDRKPEAIKAATRSMELAKAAENMDYVRMNEASIAEWSK